MRTSVDHISNFYHRFKRVAVITWTCIVLSSTMALAFQRENQHEGDSTTFMALREDFMQHRKANMAIRLAKAQKLLDYALKHDNKKWLIEGYYYYGFQLKATLDANKLSKSIDLFQKGLDLSRSMGDSLWSASMLVHLVDAYIYKHELQKAIKYVQDYVSIAKFLEDPPRLARAFELRAKVHQRLKLFEHALSDYEKSKSIGIENNMEGSVGRCTFNQALIYHQDLKVYERAYVMYKQALSDFEGQQLDYQMAAVKNALGSLFFEQQEFEKAKVYFEAALRLSNENGILYRQMEACFYLAQIFKGYETYDSALYFIDRSIFLCDSLEFLDMKIKSLEQKGIILGLKGQYQTSLLYHNQAHLLRDSLETVEDGTPNAAGILLDQQNEKHMQKEKTFQKVLARKDFWIWVTLASVLVIGSATFIIVDSIKNRMVKLTRNLRAEKKEKDHLNRKLVSNTINLAVKNDLLSHVMSALHRIKEKNTLKKVQMDIHETKKMIEDNLELNKIWDEFFLHFDAVNPRFLQELRNEYQLSKAELRLCAFLKMNLSYKEISQILNIQVNSIHVSLHRIKKKINLADDQDVYSFLQSRNEI